MAAALAVDNVMALIYFPLCNLLGRGIADPGGAADASTAATATADSLPQRDGVLETSGALAVALAIAAASLRLAPPGCA